METMDKKYEALSQRAQSLKKRKKIAEHELIEILESLPGRVYIKDKNGIYLMGNQELAKDCGFSSSLEIVGKTDYDLPSKEQADVLREVDFQVMMSGKPLILEEPGTHADGSPAIYHTRKIPLRDKNNNILGIFGLSFDITKEKQIEIMKNTREHFYWKSKDGVYLDCNNAVAKSVGFQLAEDIIGKSDYDIFNTEVADALRATDLKIITTGVPEILEEPGLRNDGSAGVFLTSKFPLHDIEGRVNSIMGFSTDITSQKQAEIAKADFISNMEHDLRSPFAGISGIATILYDMEDNPEKKELLELLVKSCVQWEETQHNILTVLSVKEPQVIHKELFSLTDELTAIKDMLGATVRLKNLDFFVDSLPEDVDEIKTDRLKFRLILSSLLGNAVKFTEKGSIRVVTVYESPIYKIHIIDTGIGIPEDKFDYIFEQFTKLTRSNKYGGDFKGVGVGLYISRQMARQLGGDISVQSKLNEGSVFTLILPRQCKNEQESPLP